MVCDWVCVLLVQYMWDLFCGVGGFGLYCVMLMMCLIGIEIVLEVIVCVRQLVVQLGFSNLYFQVLDFMQFVIYEVDVLQLVLVNLLCCGIGVELCDYLSCMVLFYIIYFSCNVCIMVIDIVCFSGYCVEWVQLFDMFFYIVYYEVLILLVCEV